MMIQDYCNPKNAFFSSTNALFSINTSHTVFLCKRGLYVHGLGAGSMILSVISLHTTPYYFVLCCSSGMLLMPLFIRSGQAGWIVVPLQVSLLYPVPSKKPSSFVFFPFPSLLFSVLFRLFTPSYRIESLHGVGSISSPSLVEDGRCSPACLVHCQVLS